MARSVSTHRHAVKTVYLHLSFGQDHIDYTEVPDDQQPDYYEFSSFIEDLQGVLDGSSGAPGGKGFPSLRRCDRWQDREDHVILENNRGEVSVSEYNGCVAICLAPLDPDNQLDRNWCDQVSESFQKLLHGAYSKQAMVSQGRFSNGEQAFALINQPGSCVTSKEGQLW